MKLLVTGSEGSLMQWTIPLLQAQGHQLTGVDNFARYGEQARAREQAQEQVRARDYEFVRGDLTDPALCQRVMAGMDGVVQAAGLIYGVGGFHKYPADILARDVTLMQNILWAMQRHGVEHIAYLSSSMVYERSRRHPSKEEDVADMQIPATDYGLSKLVGERLVQAFARQYGLRYQIWRPFNIITPHEQGEHEQGLSHVFADYIKAIVLERRAVLPIIGDGEQVRCFTWIDDVAQAIARHSFTPAAHNEIFNLGNPEPVTMKQLARLIQQTAQELKLLPAAAPPLKFQTTRSYADDVQMRIPDINKARQLLGWQPTLRLAQSVRKCLEQGCPT